MTHSTVPRAIRCHPADGVGIALSDLAAGEVIALAGERVALRAAIPLGHKFALTARAPGDVVRRYGEAIGRATAAIAPGDHVHTHNLATALVGERRYADSGARGVGPAAAPLGTWRGYARADGRFATRNEVWLLPTVDCVAPLAEMAAREA